MPVWYERVRPLVEAGALQVIGIVQEQHPDRAQLYQQWKGLDFPILWDPFGLSGVEAVPDLTAVDEHGVIRIARPAPKLFETQFMEGFMGRSFEASEGEPVPATFFQVNASARLRGDLSTEDRARRAMARLMLAGPTARTIDGEVDALASAAVEGQPRDRFRAGVGLRMRFDGPQARAADLQRSIDAWFSALMASPNQYIWRRRIQQWGPALDKPYAFYDWVGVARADIQARGERPVRLLASLSGAERAQSSRAVPVLRSGAVEPDPEDRITLDSGRLVRLEHAVALNTAVVGPRIRVPRGSLRLHVVLRPRQGATWPVDADPPVLWLEPGEGWLLASSLVPFQAPGVGGEGRPLIADLELSTPLRMLAPPDPSAPPPAATATLRGYVLYSVCEADGTCVFRRQELEAVVRFPDPRRGDSPADEAQGDEAHGDEAQRGETQRGEAQRDETQRGETQPDKAQADGGDGESQKGGADR